MQYQIKTNHSENLENDIKNETSVLDHLLFSYFNKSEKISKFLTRHKFYKFYNTVLDCLPFFYENSFIKIKDNKEIQADSTKEEKLCCLCDDKKSDVMLECCVRLDDFYFSIFSVKNVSTLGFSRR